MADLTETGTWENGIYRIETADFILGGEGGTANTQAQQLANRTAYLKARADQVDAAAGAHLDLPTRLDEMEAVIPSVDLMGDVLRLGGLPDDGYPLGCQNIPYPIRASARRIVGDVTGYPLLTITGTANRIYFLPLTVPRRTVLATMGITITTASAGTAFVGLYENLLSGGQDGPGNLIASTPVIDTGTAGERFVPITATLMPGILYWAALVMTGTPTIRALSWNCTQTSLGRAPSGNGLTTHLLYNSGAGTLPETAPTPLTDSTSNAPAIYFSQ